MRMEYNDVVAQIDETPTGRMVIGVYACDAATGKVSEARITAPNRARVLAKRLFALADKLEGRA
ncbi:MAG: hypothetical protein AAF205_00095 [Pseudomonadota bacterium]